MIPTLVGPGVISGYHSGSASINVPLGGTVEAGQVLMLVMFNATGNGPAWNRAPLAASPLTDTQGNAWYRALDSIEAPSGTTSVSVWVSPIVTQLTGADHITVTWDQLANFGAGPAAFYAFGVQWATTAAIPLPGGWTLDTAEPNSTLARSGSALTGSLPGSYPLTIAASCWSGGPVVDDPNFVPLLNASDSHGEQCVLSYALQDDALPTYSVSGGAAHAAGGLLGLLGAGAGPTISFPAPVITGASIAPDTSVAGASYRADFTATGTGDWDMGHWTGHYFDGSPAYNYPPWFDQPDDEGRGIFTGIPYDVYDPFTGGSGTGAFNLATWYTLLPPPVPGYVLGLVPVQINVSVAIVVTLTDAKALIGGQAPVNLGQHQHAQLDIVTFSGGGVSMAIATGTLIDATGTHTNVPLDSTDTAVTFIAKQAVNRNTNPNWWAALSPLDLIEMYDSVFNTLHLSYVIDLSMYLAPDTLSRPVPWPVAVPPAGPTCPAFVS